MPTVNQADSLTTICGNWRCYVRDPLQDSQRSNFRLPVQPLFLQCPGCGDVSVQTGRNQIFPGRMPSRPIMNPSCRRRRRVVRGALLLQC